MKHKVFLFTSILSNLILFFNFNNAFGNELVEYELKLSERVFIEEGVARTIDLSTLTQSRYIKSVKLTTRCYEGSSCILDVLSNEILKKRIASGETISTSDVIIENETSVVHLTGVSGIVEIINIKVIAFRIVEAKYDDIEPAWRYNHVPEWALTSFASPYESLGDFLNEIESVSRSLDCTVCTGEITSIVLAIKNRNCSDRHFRALLSAMRSVREEIKYKLFNNHDGNISPHSAMAFLLLEMELNLLLKSYDSFSEEVSDRIMALIDFLKEFATFEEYQYLLLPIKRNAGKALTIVRPRSELSGRVVSAMSELLYTIDFADPFLQSLLRRPLVMQAVERLLFYRHSIDWALR